MDRKKLVNESIDYIMEHLEEDLSLDAVADHFIYQNTISAGYSRKKPANPFMRS